MTNCKNCVCEIILIVREKWHDRRIELLMDIWLTGWVRWCTNVTFFDNLSNRDAKIFFFFFFFFWVSFIHVLNQDLTLCKVEFNQPSCWLYSVPNLLVFQQLVTLYLGEILIRVVSEIVWRNAQECARKTGTRDWIFQVTRDCKPPEAAHVPGMPKVEASC